MSVELFLGFVFTNFNNAKISINAVESIRSNAKCNYFIVIVDNASDKSDLNFLTSHLLPSNHIHIISSPENLGYFKGLNVGIKYLRENHKSVDLMIIGNNDLIFPEKFFTSLIDKADLFSKYPVISPDIITMDGFHQNPHVISSISKLREIIYDLYHSNYFIAQLIVSLAKYTRNFTRRGDEDQFKISQEIYQGYGACYILTPIFFNHFEELDSPTFLMYEEFFLAKQLNKKGFKVFYDASISLVHLMHASTDKLPGKVKWKFSRASHKEYRKHIKIL